jgi:hypothetical protein
MITNPEHYFYLNNGVVLKDLSDFLEAMNTMSSETFSYHFNSEKNDFYNWTKEILKEGILAKQILNAKNQSAIAEAIDRRIQTISKSKNKKETRKSLINQIKGSYTNE